MYIAMDLVSNVKKINVACLHIEDVEDSACMAVEYCFVVGNCAVVVDRGDSIAVIVVTADKKVVVAVVCLGIVIFVVVCVVVVGVVLCVVVCAVVVCVVVWAGVVSVLDGRFVVVALVLNVVEGITVGIG